MNYEEAIYDPQSFAYSLIFGNLLNGENRFEILINDVNDRSLYLRLILEVWPGNIGS